jgi:hypothetical protein
MSAHIGAALARILGVQFVHFAGEVAVEPLACRRWASITFTGARHRLLLTLRGEGAGPAADAFLDGLAEREFALAGQIVVDIAATRDEREEGERVVRLTIEALTVEED